MNPRDLTHLDGQSVLVRSAADHRDPPVALRGTIEARADRAGTPLVRIVLDYPDMANTASQRRVLALDGAGVERLMAGEHDGVYDYLIEGPLGAEPSPEGTPRH